MEKKNNNFMIGMSVISAMFFIFGFATTFIITLGAKVKDIFELSNFRAALLSSAFFVTYALLSIPIGLYIKKIGYKRALIIGLLLMAVGSFLFYPAASIPNFEMFLFATFILASGVVFLQTAANPYVTALGPSDTASGRLNLVQALNSIATMIAPWIISIAVFSGTSEMLSNVQKAESVQMPFVIMGIIVVLVALALISIKLPEITGSDVKRKSVWKYLYVVLGAIGIFAYVGAEVGNGSLIVKYLESMGETPEVAAKFAAIYWGGAMIGRFFASVMLSGMANGVKKYLYVAGILLLALISGAFVTDWDWKIGSMFILLAVGNFLIMQLGRGKASRTLAVFALVAAALGITTALTTGQIALWTVVSIGLFNSVMFPNIFTLAVRDLDNAELSTASGIINTLIVGGAIIPPIMGKIADNISYSWAFIVPAICYLYIFFFAVKGHSIRK